MPAILEVVADSAAPTAGDIVLRGLLEAVGYSVTYVSDEVAENTTGFQGVVIANSVVTATLGSKYDTCPLPVVFHESGYVSVMRMSSSDAFGADNNQTLVTAAAHPILDGPYGAFSGTITIFSGATVVMNIDSSATTIPSGVTAVAQHPTAAALKMILACESGAVLSSGTAPNKRAFLNPHETDAGLMTANGQAIVKNAYRWAFGETALYLYWTKRKARRGRRFTTLAK